MIWIVLILIGSLVAYASNRFTLQSISLGVICGLALVYALAPAGMSESVAPAFSGFASQALVAIVALMILGRALIVTGALQPVSTLLSAALARVPRLAFVAVIVGGFAISGFLNDTPVVVMLLPILLGAAEQAGRTPGGMLMPMNFAVIIGGMMTAIGTSTNLLVNGLSADNGGPRFSFFDFYLVALPAALLGLAYLVVVAPWLLRGRGDAPQAEATTRFLATFRLGDDSALVGKTLNHLRTQLGKKVSLRHLMRRGREVARFPSVGLRSGDMLILSGPAEALHEVADRLSLAASTVQDKGDDASRGDGPKDDAEQRRQCVVSAGSPIVDRTVRESSLEWRFDVRVVGLSELASSSSARAPADLPFIPIQAGDSLLLEGTGERIARACEMLALVPVGEPLHRRATRDAALALAVFVLVVLAAVAKVVPISVAAACGVLAVVGLGLMRWDDVESAVEWRIVLIVASSIALGDALVRSGAMDLLAGQIAAWAGAWPLPLLLGLIITVTGLLTNFVSNNAAAAIMTPLSLALARSVGAPLEPFVLGVLFGANLCFLTPFAYQTNLLVMAAAGYRFNDFIRVGLPLFVLMVPALAASLSFWYL